jgi:hypothetical protein
LRSFADLDALIGLVPAQVVTRLSAIDFGRGLSAAPGDPRMDGHRVCPLAAIRSGPIRHGG